MRSIAIMNQKGGVGKTTTTTNLAAALAARGQRVLLIDLDPQAHLTINFGCEPCDEADSIYSVLTDSAPMRSAMLQVADNVHLIPSHIDLAAAELELVSVVGREVILRDALDRVRDEFDFILVDCPPSLGILTVNALVAVEEVFIPLQPHFLALQGLGKLLDETIRLVAKRINPDLRVSGVVFTMYEGGTRLAGEILDDVREFFEASRGTDCPWSETRVFDTVIRRNIKLAEAPSHGLTIFDYEPRSNGAADYARLACEVLGISEEVEPEHDATPGEAEDKKESEQAAAEQEAPDRVVAEVVDASETTDGDVIAEVAVGASPNEPPGGGSHDAPASSGDAEASEPADADHEQIPSGATLKMPEQQSDPSDRDRREDIANIA